MAKLSPYIAVRRFVKTDEGHAYDGAYIGLRIDERSHWLTPACFNLLPGMDAPAEIPANYRGTVDIPGDILEWPIPNTFKLGNRKWRVVEIALYTQSARCVLDLPGSRLVVFAYKLRRAIQICFWGALRRLGWVQMMTSDQLLSYKPISSWRLIRPFGIGKRKDGNSA